MASAPIERSESRRAAKDAIAAATRMTVPAIATGHAPAAVTAVRALGIARAARGRSAEAAAANTNAPRRPAASPASRPLAARAAAGGNAGKRYGDSLLCESEKKTKIT